MNCFQICIFTQAKITAFKYYNDYVVEISKENLDGELGRISNKAKKRVLETVSVAKNGQHHQAVVSSTNGANILKGLDNLAEKLEKFNRGPVL